MTLDPALLPFADKAIILILVVLLFFAGRSGQRAGTFPAAPVPTTPPTKVPAPPAIDPSPAPPIVVEPDQPPAPSPPTPAPSPPVSGPTPIPPVVPPVVIAPAPIPAPAPAGSDFDRCVAVTLKWEGGNDDDPSDSGGRTSRGITAEDWASWRQTHPGLPSDDWQAPQDQILAIYKEKYWNPLYCDNLPNGVDLVVFDHGVLAGIGTSAKLLQTIVGTDVDGEIGPLTIAAAASQDPVSLVNRFCDGRQAYYNGIAARNPQDRKFINGWTNRVVGVRKEALALAADAPRPKVTTLPPAANIPAPAASSTPSWLLLARSLVGTHAQGDNAVIMAWPKAIATRFPDMAAYCSRYVHDSTPWCGLTVAYVLAMSGIRPVFGPSDTDKFLWAFAWQDWGTKVWDESDGVPNSQANPQPGDVMVFRWPGGGGHVTLYNNRVEDDFYHCCGGNQGSGHVVSIEAMPMSSCIAIRRPPSS